MLDRHHDACQQIVQANKLGNKTTAFYLCENAAPEAAKSFSEPGTVKFISKLKRMSQ